jgi:hypothetical protein
LSPDAHGAALLFLQLIHVPLSTTPAPHAIAGWLAGWQGNAKG